MLYIYILYIYLYIYKEYAVEIIKAIIVQHAKKKGKLDNPDICFCSQTQRRDP